MTCRGIAFACLVLFCAGCATGTYRGHRTATWSPRQLNRAKLPSFDIPIEVNDRVVAWIDYFQGPARDTFARYLTRSGRYIPMMQETLRKYALPQDLVYLALIESGFSTKAYSRAHAAGCWQFIKGTGRRYNLDINHWVDERLDPEKSTVAAAKYLRDLFDRFGNWYLAMAAYNAGEGKIDRAIERTGRRNFWEIVENDKRYLKSETKDYVPKFIAAAIIAKSPERFGFGDVVYNRPMDFETVKINNQTDLEVVAKCAGVPADDVITLNPELVKETTPPGASNYQVRLPVGTAGQFEVAYANLPPQERMVAVRHIIRRGESLAKIARRYGVTIRELMAANDLDRASDARKGRSLVIPVGSARKKAQDAALRELPAGGVTKYRVKRGDTLGLIAQNHGVGVSSLKRWNNLSKNTIREGQILRIRGTKTEEVASRAAISYNVKRGDSWWKVAQKYGVSINELKEWNPAIASGDLVAGRKLNLFAIRETKEPKISESDLLPLGRPINFSREIKTSDTMTMSQIAVPRAAIDKPKANETGPEVKYKIKSGDTVWDIAKKYGVSTGDILAWNNLEGGAHKRLRPGDIIKLRLASN